MDSPGRKKFEQFRKEFPFFSYEGFEADLSQDGLIVSYTFNLSDRYIFRPGFQLPFKSFLKKQPDKTLLNSESIQNLLFHIGMIELVSYWKAACPPRVIIKGHELNDYQKAWWKNVYYQGLGEFFHFNGIQAGIEEFMQIESSGKRYEKSVLSLNDTVLLPIGGGKDSIVSLELLRKEFDIRPFILNPRGASLETCFKAGFSNNAIAEINRRLDPLLLQLNEQGFLNGHTPFSALLAFYTLLVSTVCGNRNIALSNEASANEPTIPGTEINHQYSKSYAFEKDFREYVAGYISEEFNYFSFLRPLSELQIAQLFSNQVKYYSVFKSCNVGSKTDSWCGHCPKCLFAWIILSPFIPVNELTHIFGKNLFEDAGMIRYLKELSGIDEVKPFECVGTVDEVNAALHLFIHHHAREKWPLLIDYYSNTAVYSQSGPAQAAELLKKLNPEHFLEEPFLRIILNNIQ